MPEATARVTASARLPAPSLFSSWATWYLAVFSLMIRAGGDLAVRPALRDQRHDFALAAAQLSVS